MKKYTTKELLRALTKQLHLKVKYVDSLPDDKFGQLLIPEKRILINARKPRCEHPYTILHEIGHYLLHFKTLAPNRYNRWYLNRRWKIDAIAQLASKVRRFIRRIFNRESGKEWEADLWAMCAFAYLKRFIGRSDLTAFLNRHPEKRWIYWLAATSTAYCDTKKRLATAFKVFNEARHGLSGQSS